MLALESNRVIRLRLTKLMRGGKVGRIEAERMVTEKLQATANAGVGLVAGASRRTEQRSGPRDYQSQNF